MAGYLPAAAAERAAQYAALGLSGPEALYRDVPESVRLTAPLNLPPPSRSWRSAAPWRPWRSRTSASAPSCGGPGLTTTTSPRR